MDQTARFALPQLAPGQSQKEFYHNEALQRVDMLLCPVVEEAAATTPPANPTIGSCYIIGGGASGAWAVHEDTLACFTEGGWRFVVPIEGMSVLDRISGQLMVRRDGIWESGIVHAREIRVGNQTVVRDRQPAISNPSGGAAADAECRSVVINILNSLRTHGLID